MVCLCPFAPLTGTLLRAGSNGRSGGVVYWYALQSVIPIAGMIWLSCLSWWVYRKRTVDRSSVFGLAAAVISILPLGWRFQIGAIPYPIEYDPSKALAIRVPMDGAVLVIWGGETLETNRHTSKPDLRWAYDLALEPVLTGSENLSDYGCWDRPVMAPVSGTVTRIENEIPDQIPGSPTENSEEPLGNHIVLQPDGGGYLILARLKQGSVLVEPGATVREAQELARCGNSGRTSEPHLHVYYQEQDPADHSVGYAIGRPLVFKEHGSSPMPKGGIEVVNGMERPKGEYIQSQSKTRAK